MATQTLEHVDSIEHLDFRETSKCDACGKKAEVWTDTHGCTTGYCCAPCVGKNRLLFERKVATFGHATCARCFSQFTAYGRFVQVVPL